RVSSAGEALTEAALQRILFDLPLAVELRDFRAERIAVINAAGATVEIDTIAGAASLDGDALTVTRLRVRQRDASLGAELRLTRNLAVSGTAQWQLAYAEQDYAGT